MGKRCAASSPKPDRAVRVFVSSTFQDMRAERDFLAKFTFPELRNRCRERGVSFAEVDLRWGITEKQVQEGKVLPICLEEIRNCHPFFIGMLGDRYGSPANSFPAHLIDKFPWLSKHRGRSYTELEIIHGVLNDPLMKSLAFFYFRGPADHVNTHKASSRNQTEVESKTNRKKLQSLKERIRRGGYRLARYRTPRELGSRLLEDLWAIIDQRFPATGLKSILDRQAADHEAFAGNRSRVYIPRGADFRRLDAHAKSTNPPLVLLGESGVGKTALAANWARRHRAGFPEDTVLLHFIGSTPESADPETIIRRIASEIQRRWAPGDRIPDSGHDLRNTFSDWLSKVPGGERLILVLDGLNQLDSRDRSAALDWLPDLPPVNVRVLCSTLPGPTLDSTRRKGWAEYVVAGLNEMDRWQLIRDFLADFRKIPEDFFKNLARTPLASNPLYLRAILEEMRIGAEQSTLKERLDKYLEAKSLPELYDRILERLEEDYSPKRPYADLVRDSMTLLWASPRGLSQNEIRELAGDREKPIPMAFWSPLYLALQESLVSRSGYLTFFHDMLRQAVRNRYLQTPEEKFEAHKKLSEYFECMFSQLGEKEGYRALSLRSAEEALRIADRAKNPELRTEGCLLVAGASISQAVGVSPENARHFTRAWKMARKAGELAEKSGRKDLLADSYCLRARIESNSNPDLGRLDLLDKAVDLRTQQEDQEGLRDTLFDRAVAAMRKGELDKVEGPLWRAEQTHNRIMKANPLNLAHIRQVFGEYYYLRGWWKKALRALEESRGMYRKHRYPGGVCAAEGWLGLCHCRLGRDPEGLRLVQKSLAFERLNLGSVEGSAKWLHAAGDLFLDRSEVERGLDALAMAEELRIEQNHGELPRTVGAISRARNQYPDRYRKWKAVFDPRKTEFSPYAFLWGLGPFRKTPDNPLLSARDSAWESRSVFNPAAWTADGEVHLLYRAQGEDGISRIGMAASRDGLNFELERKPILSPTAKWEQGGGCEDPRVIRIDDRLVMTYTAYDGNVARLALADSRDGKRWTNRRLAFSDDQWDGYFPVQDRPQTPRGWSKSGAILSRKTSGEYWMYFGDTQIWAACSKDLKLWNVIPEPVISPHPGFFDSFLVEPGPPPVWLAENPVLNRPAGILLIYNGAEKTAGGLRYHVGQVLLDPTNPNRVLRRSVRPLLSPTTVAERKGQTPNVVFASGLVQIKDEWLLYYGMADTAIGVAICKNS